MRKFWRKKAEQTPSGVARGVHAIEPSDDQSNLNKRRPPEWKESPLTQFFEWMWSNSIATFANFGEAKRVRDVDALLWHFAQNLSRVKNKANVAVGLPLMLVFRAHAAFRSGASLALSGSAPEAMAALRLSLETAGYASMIQGNEALSLIWLERGDSTEAKKKARDAFTFGNVRRALEVRDGKIGEQFVSLYEYLIDAGAHPNERGMIRSLQVERLADGGARLTQIYLHENPDELERAVKSVGQVGVCVLMIFELMYPDEFKELGLSERLPIVSKGISWP